MREFCRYAKIAVARLVRYPGEEQFGEFLRRTARQQQIVHIVERGCDLPRQQSGALKRGVGVVLDQIQEAFTFDELNLAEFDGGNCNWGGRARHHRTQSITWRSPAIFRMIVLPSR